MSTKEMRIIHVETPLHIYAETDKLNTALRDLVGKAENSVDLMGILNKAVHALYVSQENGFENYSGDSPRVGYVRVRPRADEAKGCLGLVYVPSQQYKTSHNYLQRSIGQIDLRDRTYSPGYGKQHDENCSELPEILMKDTDRVMESLGLKIV